MRRAVARPLSALAVILAALASACGAADLVSVNEPLPNHAAMTFTVSKISGTDFEAPEGGTQEGGMQFNLANDTVLKDLFLWTRCGVLHSSHVEITGDHVVATQFDDRLEPAKCTPEQLAAVKRVGEVLASSPRYRFDGERLQLVADKTTVTFVLRNTTPLVNGNTVNPR
jgi:hypothetical protein